MFSIIALALAAVCVTTPVGNEPTCSTCESTPLTNLASIKIYWEIPDPAIPPDDQGNFTLLTGSEEFPETRIGVDICYDNIQVPITGTYTVYATATNTLGEESRHSVYIVKDGTATQNPPRPPIILNSERTAYTVIKQPDSFLLLPIGTVPAATECSQDQSVNGHGVVPNSAVNWTSPTGSRPIVVVALCRF